MADSKHTFKDCEVICTPLQQAGGARPYYCRVFKDGRRVLSVVIPEADSAEEAAREAKDFIV